MNYSVISLENGFSSEVSTKLLVHSDASRRIHVRCLIENVELKVIVYPSFDEYFRDICRLRTHLISAFISCIRNEVLKEPDIDTNDDKRKYYAEVIQSGKYLFLDSRDTNISNRYYYTIDSQFWKNLQID